MEVEKSKLRDAINKLVALCLIITILTFTFSGIISATPMYSNSTSVYEDLITPDKARLYAAFELKFFTITGLTQWEGAETGDPIPLFNMENEHIFYIVPLIKNESIVGSVLINSRKSRGVAVFNIDPNPRDINSAYSWVRFLKFKLTPEETAKGRELWAKYDAIVTQKYPILTEASYVEKQLDVPVYMQKTYYYCSPASAQMVLAYHGYTYTQDEIAEAMGTIPEKGTYPWNIDDGIEEVTGGQVQAWNHYGIITPWHGSVYNRWVEEIDNDRPGLVSYRKFYWIGSYGHTEAGRGYKYSTDWWAFWERYYILNDPWDGTIHYRRSLEPVTIVWTFIQP